VDLDAVLRNQLEMNPRTWQAMTDLGVAEETALRLDFAYAAPGQVEANQLAAFLQRETDYAVQASSVKKGPLSRRVWFVEGTTNATTLSLDVLNQWVEWMVLAGYENGKCEFDGWGAQLPDGTSTSA
jgi:hypothetical protein